MVSAILNEVSDSGAKVCAIFTGRRVLEDRRLQLLAHNHVVLDV